MSKFKNYLIESNKPKILNELFIKSNEIFNMKKGKEKDIQIVRLAMIAEIDAVSLYESMILQAKNRDLKAILQDVANEEKVHVGEFEAILEFLDPDWEELEDEGEEEAEQMMKKESIDEAVYAGNIGFEELISFYKKASSSEIKQMEKIIKIEDWNEFKKLIKKVLGVLLK